MSFFKGIYHQVHWKVILWALFGFGSHFVSGTGKWLGVVWAVKVGAPCDRALLTE